MPSWRTSIRAWLDRMESITFATVLGPGRPGDAAVCAIAWRSPLVVVAPGRGVGERLANGVVVEDETGALERGRDGALPHQQALVGELAQRGPEGETGHHQRGRPVDRPPEGRGEFRVGDRRGPRHVHRAGQLG